MSEINDWKGASLSGGRYVVTELLGEGGMAHVYVAHDRNLETDVAIKVPRRAFLNDDTFVRRFSAEVRSLVKLRHPHVVSVLDVGEHHGAPFMVMDLLSGGTLLQRYSDESTDHTLRMLWDWLPKIAEALDFIDQQGYVHRDVKPENVLFDEHGNAFLGDFGIVKVLAAAEADSQTRNLTRNGIPGTPEYMAPEVIQEHSLDGRADQYSLAVTVYELLAGRRPFEDKAPAAVLVKQVHDEPPPLDSFLPTISPSLVKVIRKGLSKQPAERFPTCVSFCGELLSAAQASSTPTQPPPIDRQKKARLECPECGSKLTVSYRMQGKSAVCPKCKSRLTVAVDLTSLSRVAAPAVVAVESSTVPPRNITPPIITPDRQFPAAAASPAAPPTTPTSTPTVRVADSPTQQEPSPPLPTPTPSGSVTDSLPVEAETVVRTVGPVLPLASDSLSESAEAKRRWNWITSRLTRKSISISAGGVAALLLLMILLFRATGFSTSYDDGVKAYYRCNYEEALTHLKPLAEEGNAKARYYVGRCYHHQGFSPGSDKVVSWYRRALSSKGKRQSQGLARLAEADDAEA